MNGAIGVIHTNCPIFSSLTDFDNHLPTPKREVDKIIRYRLGSLKIDTNKLR